MSFEPTTDPFDVCRHAGESELDACERWRQVAESNYPEGHWEDPSTITHLIDAVTPWLIWRVRTLEEALRSIASVEPSSGTSRLDIVDWARALDEAQRIATDALRERA